ncbi:unnamed protein product, partial [Didymodactylos carnosus]
VSSESCRFIVGAVLGKNQESADEDLMKRMIAEEYKTFQLPKSVQSVYTAFPCESVFSIYIAIHRVYRHLSSFIQTKKLQAYPFVEYYEPTLIHFYAPLSNHDAYNVPDLKLVEQTNKTD